MSARIADPGQYGLWIAGESPRRDVCCLQHVICCAFAEGNWLPEDGDPIDPRNGLLEQFQTFAD